jgi:hypothetical protein
MEDYNIGPNDDDDDDETNVGEGDGPNDDDDDETNVGEGDGPNDGEGDIFLKKMKILFKQFFEFKDILPTTANIPDDKISSATTLAKYLVGQTDKNETKGLLERASKTIEIIRDPNTRVSDFFLLIYELKKLYNKNHNFKILVDFCVRQEIFEITRKAFFVLANSDCENMKTIPDAKTLLKYIHDSLIPKITTDQSTFEAQVNPMVDFMTSLLNCMASVLNTNTPLPVTNADMNTDMNAATNNLRYRQRMRQTILNLNPNFYSELKTFIYKYLALFLCHIVEFTTIPEKTLVTTIPLETWGFILPVIDNEIRQHTNIGEISKITQFIQNNSMLKLLTLKYPDIQLDNIHTLPKNNTTLKTKIQNECNALRQMLEYNLIKNNSQQIATNSQQIAPNSQQIATNLVSFASYSFGPNREIYEQTNTPFSETYLKALNNRLRENNNEYLSSMLTKITDLSTNQNVQTNEENDTVEPKYIFTPTTKTTVTVVKQKSVSTCLARDMFPPDGQFAPIAKLMKAKAKSLNLEEAAKQMYNQILVDRSKCKATVNRLYSTTLSSMNATKWDKLGGRGGRKTRKHRRRVKSRYRAKPKTVRAKRRTKRRRSNK